MGAVRIEHRLCAFFAVFPCVQVLGRSNIVGLPVAMVTSSPPPPCLPACASPHCSAAADARSARVRMPKTGHVCACELF